MRATVVGGDRLGNIPALLGRHGIFVLRHVSGRDATDQRRVSRLPQGTDLLILFTDFLNHNATQGFRRAARAQTVPLIASRRSGASLARALAQHGLIACSN
jgi:hypothetical protein